MMNYIVSAFLFLQLTYVYTILQGRSNHGLIKTMYKPTLHSAKKCKLSMCEYVSNYPEAQIENMIKSNSALRSYFGGSIIEPSPSEILSLRTRIKEEPPMPFCKTKDVSMVPKIMIDIDGVERLIANVQNYSQVVKFQVCRDENMECYLGNTFGYTTSCVQKYNDIKLIAVNYPRGLEYRKFRIPSTCVCHYRTVDPEY